MKKAEIDKLVIGSIIRHRSNNKEYKVVEITEYDITTKCLTEEDSRISTFNTLKRWYDVVEYEPQVEEIEVPKEKIEEEKPARKIEIIETLYKEGQIVTDTKHLENFFIRRIIPKRNIKGEMEYEYTMANMHTNEEVILAEVTIKAFFVLTTNEWNEKVQKAHRKG